MDIKRKGQKELWSYLPVEKFTYKIQKYRKPGPFFLQLHTAERDSILS